MKTVLKWCISTCKTGHIADPMSVYFKLCNTDKRNSYALYWLLPSVNHPVHSQVMGTFEGSSTILADVVPLI